MLSVPLAMQLTKLMLKCLRGKEREQLLIDAGLAGSRASKGVSLESEAHEAADH